MPLSGDRCYGRREGQMRRDATSKPQKKLPTFTRYRQLRAAKYDICYAKAAICIHFRCFHPPYRMCP